MGVMVRSPQTFDYIFSVFANRIQELVCGISSATSVNILFLYVGIYARPLACKTKEKSWLLGISTEQLQWDACVHFLHIVQCAT